MHKNALFSQKKSKNISERYLRHRGPLKRKRGNDSGRMEQHKKTTEKKEKRRETALRHNVSPNEK